MDMLEIINNCKSDEELKSVISSRLSELDNKATKVDQIGFLDYGKSINLFKGFIPFSTRVKYDRMAVTTYSMNTVDFFYECANFIRKFNITSKGALISGLETFMNMYFGYPGNITRDNIFEERAWSQTTTDEEYFKALENNTIGYLKGTGAAECTERSALANQLLSFFGTEVYFCMGCLDNNGREEAHAFNVVKRKNDYALLDYSVPVTSFKSDNTLQCYYPFVGTISESEFVPFVNGDDIKTFNDHYYVGKERKENSCVRSYVVGRYELNNENREGIRRV